MAARTNKLPIIGPVHEKETTTKVSAIKKMPIKFPVSALLSALFDHDAGRAISKAPKNEMPKIKNTAKKIRLAIQLVAKLFNAAGPNIRVIRKPNKVKITTMEVEYKNAFFIPSSLVRLR